MLRPLCSVFSVVGMPNTRQCCERGTKSQLQMFDGGTKIGEGVLSIHLQINHLSRTFYGQKIPFVFSKIPTTLPNPAEALTNPTPFGPGVTPWPPWRNFNLALSSPMSTSRARCRRPSSAIFTKTWQSHPVHWWQIPCEKWQFPESRKCMISWVKNTKSNATIF